MPETLAAEEAVPLEQAPPLRRYAWMLSWAGVVPFVAIAAALAIIGADNALAGALIDVFKVYSIVNLPFLGGIRWGYALRHLPDRPSGGDILSLALSVIPALAAWAIFFVPVEYALPLLLLLYSAQGAWDSFSANIGRLPQWFAPLRITVTIIVALSHITVILLGF